MFFYVDDTVTVERINFESLDVEKIDQLIAQINTGEVLEERLIMLLGCHFS
jgi:hypothetical protein